MVIPEIKPLYSHDETKSVGTMEACFTMTKAFSGVVMTIDRDLFIRLGWPITDTFRAEKPIGFGWYLFFVISSAIAIAGLI